MAKKIKYTPMSGEELKLNRKKLGLTIPTMAKILCTSIVEYKRYEKEGLRAPHDFEGPSVRIVQMLTFQKKIGIIPTMLEEIRKHFGYDGPEKKFSGVELLYK